MSRDEEVLQILGGDKESHFKLMVGDGYVAIEFGSMYEAPALDLSALVGLRDYFGASDVKVDTGGFSHSGCQSCDWGSLYGQDIKILNPTKNVGASS